jgi:hypothetical protein
MRNRYSESPERSVSGKEPRLFSVTRISRAATTASSAAANPNRAGVYEIAGSNLIEKIALSRKE